MPPFAYSEPALVLGGSTVVGGTVGQFLYVGTGGFLAQSTVQAREGYKNLTGTFTAASNQLSVDADSIALRTSAGLGVSINNPGAAIVCDIDTAGPIINGRDQAAAFGATDTVHFYHIYNPTTATLATIASLTAPPTGPTMPTGYTFFAYIGSMILTAGSMRNATLQGEWITFVNGITVATGAAAGVKTNVSLATTVPAVSPRVQIIVATANDADAGGNRSQSVSIYNTGAAILGTVSQVQAFNEPAFSTVSGNADLLEIPHDGSQQIAYISANTTGTAFYIGITVTGYACPNNA